MTTAPGRAPLVFVDDLGAPELDPGDRHHLERVLRLRAGAALILGDGRGAWRPARLGPTVEPEGDIARVERPEPAITVAFAPVKGDRPEWAVQKLTELGVDRITLLEAARSVVRWRDAARSTHRARLTRVVRSAAMQSRRLWLPALEGPVPVADVLARPGAALAAPAGAPLTLATPCVLVGPEGGWTDEELARAAAVVGLNDGILRTETAAVTAGALLAELRLHQASRNVTNVHEVRCAE